MSAQNISKKVPKYGPAVPPVGVLWSALRTAGEAIDLPFLAGISGAAFRMCFDENGGDDVLWLGGNRIAENVLPILGYELHSVTHGFPHGAKDTPEEWEKRFTEVRVTLDAGTPVMLTGSFGWALVLGYDTGQRQYWVRQISPWDAVHDMSRCPPWEAGLEQEERWEDESRLAEAPKGINLAFLRKRGKALPKKGLAINALRHVVAHAKKKDKGSKHLGLDALKFFSERLAREADEMKWDAHVCGASLPMQVIFMAINRAAAAAFLKEAVVDFSGEKKSLLGDCASLYEESAQEWLMLQAFLANPKAFYENKAAVTTGPEVLRNMSESFRKIFGIEERAIHLLEGVV